MERPTPATLTLVPPGPDARNGRKPSARRCAVIVGGPESPPLTPALSRELHLLEHFALPVDLHRLDSILGEPRSQTRRLVLCTQRLHQIDEEFLEVCRSRQADVFVLADPVYGVFRPTRVHRFGGMPWLPISRRSGRSGERVKRCVDLALTISSIPVILPLMLLIALVTCTSGRPLYFQTRVGAGGRTFRMIKFRTMVVGAERESGPALSGVGDLRVTRVGRFLRRTRLDELPQLWNVLRGQMSLVGPRPERPEFAAELRRLPYYTLRELIRPGMTGIAQLTGGYAATPQEKLRCDLLYLHSRSMRSDLVLLMTTVLDLCRGFPRG